MLFSHPVRSSQQVPFNLTKGTGTALSAMIFANWSDLLIGTWGGLELFPDPYTFASTSEVAVYAYQLMCPVLRHTASFAAIVDMITT